MCRVTEHASRLEVKNIKPCLIHACFVQVWQAFTDIVADYTTVMNPNKIGVLPPATVDDQPSYAWWVASGFSDTRSGFTTNVGGIFLIDMTAEKWRKGNISV